MELLQIFGYLKSGKYSKMAVPIKRTAIFPAVGFCHSTPTVYSVLSNSFSKSFTGMGL